MAPDDGSTDAERARTFAGTAEEQAEFEQLLREHDGDWAAAVAAHQRGVRPRGEPEGKTSA